MNFRYLSFIQLLRLCLRFLCSIFSCWQDISSRYSIQHEKNGLVFIIENSRTQKTRQLIVIGIYSLFLFSTAGLVSAKTSDYVGRPTCKPCHEAQDKLWTNSHHDLAMQIATKHSVAGNFSDKKLNHFGTSYKFYKKNESFFVRTDNPDNKELQDYLIKYTFGVYPLQQYLIELPGGRLQALDVAWDNRPSIEGGQIWFHLQPGKDVFKNKLSHWTRPGMNWNYMCADCHSTNLKKNYNENSSTYNSSWSEIDVSCEACHGPGSDHIRWTKSNKQEKIKKDTNKGLTIIFDEHRNNIWSINHKTEKPQLITKKTRNKEIEVCAKCHSRRSQLNDKYKPGDKFLDSYYPYRLTKELYYADGQALGETYVYGTFLQSKMYHSGVICSDCHDAHTADLKLPGDQVCYQCHKQQKFATSKHHFHNPGLAGASCIGCHMPTSKQMVIDTRHDHSFRIPIPSLSVKIGTPNTCNNCHTDQTYQWSDNKVKQWYGKQPIGFQQYGSTMNAARLKLPDASDLLQELAANKEQAIIAKASALFELGYYQNLKSLALIKQGIYDDNPLIRIAALEALQNFSAQQRLLAVSLLNDDVRAVRIEVARLIISVKKSKIPEKYWKLLRDVIDEYIEMLKFNADRPESQTNLGNIYLDLNKYKKSESAYRNALELQQNYFPATINLAQLLIQTNRKQEASDLFRHTIESNPDSAELHYGFGLALVQQKNHTEAIIHFHSAAKLSPESTLYNYTYAIALQSQGHIDKALSVLEAARINQPDNIEILTALVLLNKDSGYKDKALNHAKHLIKQIPKNKKIQQIIYKLDRI